MCWILAWELGREQISVVFGYSKRVFKSIEWTGWRKRRPRWEWCLVAQSCLTLCDPMDCSPPGSSIHGISQARILEWVTISFSMGSSWPWDRTCVSSLLHWQVDSLTLSHQGSPKMRIHENRSQSYEFESKMVGTSRLHRWNERTSKNQNLYKTEQTKRRKRKGLKKRPPTRPLSQDRNRLLLKQTWYISFLLLLKKLPQT